MSPYTTSTFRRPYALSATALAVLLAACGGGHEEPEQAVNLAVRATPAAAVSIEEEGAALHAAAPVDWGMGPGVALSTLGRMSALSYDGRAHALDAQPGNPTAHVTGVFGETFTWPIIPVHTTLLADGRVLSFGTDETGQQSGLLRYVLWNPAQGTGPDAMQVLDNTTGTDIFCAGQALMPNGNVLLVGGDRMVDGYRNYANEDVNIFNPADNSLAKQAPMAYQRWYATVVTNGQGEQVVLGGRMDRKPAANESMTNPTVDTYASMPEVYAEGLGFRSLSTAVDEQAYGSKGIAAWNYPRAWLAPTGKIIVINSQSDIFTLDTSGTGTVRAFKRKAMPEGRYTRPGVMYQPGKILTLRNDGVTYTVDVNRPKVLTIAPTGTTTVNGEYSNATVLADGKVWANGGSSTGNTLAGAAYTSQMWDPATGVWTDMAVATKARLYHSVAKLLPDGSVLTGGGGAPGPVTNMNAEIYYPPYLFKTDGSGEWAPRPQVLSAPGVATWGETVPVELAADTTANRVSLVRMGSVTHAFDNDQRFQALTFTQTGSMLGVKLPASGNVAPPGFYMLFVLDAAGVPSVARVIRIG